MIPMIQQSVQIAADALTQYRSLWLIVMAAGFLVLEQILPHHPVNRRRHLHLDFLGVVAGLAFVAISYGSLRWLGALMDGLVWEDALPTLHDLPSPIKVLLVIIAVDFVIYWLHAFMHQWQFSWRMHRWHHSIEEMYWFSGLRASFPHVFLYAIPQVVLPVFIFDLSAAEMLVATGVGNFVQLWTHTNLKIHIGPLGWLLVTPNYHRVHHRTDQARPTNLGNLLTVWDRLFGTYEAPVQTSTTRLGLAERAPHPLRMLMGI